MTSHWPTSSKALAACLWLAANLSANLAAGVVTGKVDLRDSRDPGVRRRQNYSGVVVSLTPEGPAPVRSEPVRHLKILQKDKEFVPHVLAIPVGSFVDFPNLDPIFHNAFSSYSGQIFDVGLYPPGGSRSVQFSRPGVVRVFCNIHSAMSAMIVVLATPYFAVSKEDGSFTLDNVPEGEYTLRVVHERSSEDALRGLTRLVTVPKTSLVLPPITISEGGYLSTPHNNKYGREYEPDSAGHMMYPSPVK